MLNFETSQTSLTLLEGLRADDDDAWNMFVSIVGKTLYGLCRRSGLTDADSADIMQETLIKVRSGLPAFRRQGKGSFRAWINRIRKNVIIDFARKRARDASSAEDSRILREMAASIDVETGLSESDPAHTLLVRSAIDEIQSEFNEKSWKSFWLTNVRDVSAPEVAKELGMSHGAVRAATFRVRKRLQELLRDLFN